MAWDGSGNFARTNGTNSGATTWSDDRDAGTKILSTRHDTHDQDLADGIEACLAHNGENAMSGDLDTNGNDIIIDADADSKWLHNTDDQISLQLGGTASYVWSATAFDINGLELILDVDADTSITASTDDQIDIKIGGSDIYTLTATSFDINGQELILDADADTSITADTDDRIDFRMSGADFVRMRIDSGHGELQVLSTDAGATVGPFLTLLRDGASPADSDGLGAVRYAGDDDAGNQTTYAQIHGAILDTTDSGTTEDGELLFSVAKDGSLEEGLKLTTSSNGATYVQIRDAVDSATVGPILALWRNSATPTAADILGEIIFVGEDSGSNQTQYAKLQASIEDPTDTSEDGTFRFHVMTAGTLTEVGRFNGTQLLIGKTAAGIDQGAGVQAGTGGVLMATSTVTPLSLNLLDADGDLVKFFRDDSEVGDITVSSGTVSLTGFTGAHAAQWGTGHEPDEMPELGTLLCAVDEPMPGARGATHPKVRIAREAGEKAIYGVFAGVKDTGELQVWSSGVGVARVIGPIENGDLLESSEIPGVARRQADDFVRASTLAKATRGDSEMGERLVAWMR